LTSASISAGEASRAADGVGKAEKNACKGGKGSFGRHQGECVGLQSEQSRAADGVGLTEKKTCKGGEGS
jgi:hypothetical protein